MPACVVCLPTASRAPSGASPDVFDPTWELLLDTLANLGHSAFRALLQHSAVRSAIGGALNGAPFTVFAPTDESLVRLPAAIVAVLRNSSQIETLRQVVLYHFVREKISRFAWECPWRTMQGESVVLHLDSANLTVSDVPVLEYAASFSTSFVLHATDGLLFPPSTLAHLTGVEGRARRAAQLAEFSTAPRKEASAGGEGSGESGGDEYTEEYEEDYDEDVWRRFALQQYDSFNLYAPAPAPAPSAPSSDSCVYSGLYCALMTLVCSNVWQRRRLCNVLTNIPPSRHASSSLPFTALSPFPSPSSPLPLILVPPSPHPRPPFPSPSSPLPLTPLPPFPAVAASLSAGAIAGIVIGCVAGVVLIAALLYYLLVARHNKDVRALFCCYPPLLDLSVVWAVKRAKVLTNDFKREIKEMASKHHPNLVRLLGYCLDMDMVNERMEQILVYQFMRHGDLEYWVGNDAAKALTLVQRMDVLVGAAHGLEYLHSFGIVHRDIKLANILLDEHMHAKVADFGLVRMGEGTSVYTTRILGTPGYVDPAYSRTRKATTATDVFSFGIVILEVITGRRALVNTGSGNSTIKEWVSEPSHVSLLYYRGFW
ncbi:unnamed protein product [Closterium sp. Yama58-4]|nr:unnamed protein product [Closterium sp. Yama58-4]